MSCGRGLRIRACQSSNTAASGNGSGDHAQAGVRKQVVVVGAGFGGLGAAHALAKAGASVTVLEAGDSVGGLSSAFRTKAGRVVEPGIKGFWDQYKNIESLLAELGIQDALTDWTCSSFYSPRGLQVQAPVFKNQPRLPTPLGSFLYTAPFFTQLPLTSRLSAVALVESLLEHNLDDESYLSYDSISAKQLFSAVSPDLYRDFLEPILLVTLFAPGKQLSAAAALACLNYFALAHQADFDVRWCRGPVGERIIKPWAERLQLQGVKFRTGRRVTQIAANADGLPGRVVTSTTEGREEAWEADALVLSASVPALQRIVEGSPVLKRRREFAALSRLKAIDVMAVRLWLDRRVAMPTPSNVAVGFDSDVGATFFDLTALQDEYRDEPGTVVEVDFYNATQLLPLTDSQAVERALRVYLAGSVPAFAGTSVRDFSVIRCPRAVTAFSPGSATALPGTSTSFSNVFFAGDFVAQGPGTHGAKGLSQEKAFVAGLTAGNKAAARLGLAPVAEIIPGELDEAHVRMAQALLRRRRQWSKNSAWAL